MTLQQTIGDLDSLFESLLGVHPVEEHNYYKDARSWIVFFNKDEQPVWLVLTIWADTTREQLLDWIVSIDPHAMQVLDDCYPGLSAKDDWEVVTPEQLLERNRRLL